MDPTAAQPSLTTDYTPLQRGALAGTPRSAAISQQQTSTAHPTTSHEPLISTSASTYAQEAKAEEGPDPSTLPPATAPPSHPKIDPTVPGTLDGRSIFDVDLGAMNEKPWRRPGSDISDWFNYGFDETSWEAYCYRRRELGELANVLKVNVIVRPFYLLYFSASVHPHISFRTLLECQKTNLPPYRLNCAQW